MSNFLYVGSSNSGKTNILKEKYKNLIAKGAKGNEIMVFISSKSQDNNWNDIDTNTFYKIIQSHVILFWPLIEKNIKSGKINPKFLGMEISEYLINKLVDKYRENGRFLDINIPNSVLSSDILNNISKLSLNSIEFNKIDELLCKFLDGNNLLTKDNISSIRNIINTFSKKNINDGVLNFSLACYLFDRYILNDKIYEDYIINNIKYLIVDDIQEKSFLETKFIEKLMSIVCESHISYNTDGPITRILGADESSIKELIFNKCRLVQLGSKKIIDSNKISIKSNTLRSEMIVSISDIIDNLIKEGYKEDDIDIIGPFVDSILENRLKKEMKKKNLKFKVMTRSGYISDNPFINALVTICLLVNNLWSILPNKDSITKTMALVLNIDMIRARYLTEEITKIEPYELPHIEELSASYLEYGDIEKYSVLRTWIYEHRKLNLDVNLLFKKLFLDILLPLEVSNENLKTCSYLISLSKEFLDYANENEKLKIDKNRNFIDMILKGIRVSDSNENEEQGYIRLWTSYAYLIKSKQSKIQIWADSYSDVWHQVGIKRYYNPFIFLKENINKDWDFESENKYKILQTNSIIMSLLRKVSDRLYIFGSEFNSNGYEQRGELLEYLNGILKGEN